MTDRRPVATRPTITRRQTLQFGGLALAAIPFWQLFGMAAATTTPRTELTEGETRAGEWSVDETVTAFAANTHYQFAAPHTFGALGAHWAAEGGDDVHLAISSSADGVTWEPWRITHADTHRPDPDRAPGRADRYFAELLHLPTSSFIRCKVVDHDGRTVPAPPDLRLVYIDGSLGPNLANQRSGGWDNATSMPKVIARAQWGCDEKLRFDAKGKEIWEPEYLVNEKIIVHHTDTPNDGDPAAAVRSVYYYHAITQGWGDIGYNFLIDRNGNVYEGRFGGENVVAGHALRYNYGSVGIALLGAFAGAPAPSPSPSASPSPGAKTPTPAAPPVPTAAAEAALVQLASYKARFLDVLNPSYFVDKTIQSVVGHRDVLSTSCPGDNFYPHLASIRKAVADQVGPPPTIALSIVGITGQDMTVYTRSPITVRVKVKNTGAGMAPCYFDQGVLYTEGETFDGKGYKKVPGRFRVVADVEGSATFGTANANPYRWGMGTSLNPGETVEAVCRIAFATKGVKKLRFGLVREQSGYIQEGLEGPTITVVGLPTDGVAKPTNVGPDLLYFTETQHTLGGAILRYWNNFGGLAQFGYPLTEPYTEVSETDGKDYVVQYFERARFELHPENAGTDYEVLLGHLGRKYHPADKPVAALAGQRFFPESGHNLGGLFREYWEQYGGLFIYGVPMSEEFTEISKIDNKPYKVQYFERARFEYHPENTGKSQVLLGHLGRQLLQDRGWMK
ncbi:MAG: N-acetylmuramoyl-L-alanine amidase [Chloroflexia bacterium]